MNRAILVIDMLNDFMDPRGALYCGKESRKIIPVIASLVKYFEREAQLILYLTDAHKSDDLEFQLFPDHAVKGSWGGQIIDELKPPAVARVIEKTRFSSFYRTDLEAALTEWQPERVWVTGVCTSICVMDTVGDLRNRDYTPVVVDNAVADFNQQFHDLALIRMERVYGAVRTVWDDRSMGPATATEIGR